MIHEEERWIEWKPLEVLHDTYDLSNIIKEKKTLSLTIYPVFLGKDEEQHEEKTLIANDLLVLYEEVYFYSVINESYSFDIMHNIEKSTKKLNTFYDVINFQRFQEDLIDLDLNTLTHTIIVLLDYTIEVISKQKPKVTIIEE